MEFISVKDAAGKWNIPQHCVLALCFEKRIPGISLSGGNWLIPDGAPRPDLGPAYSSPPQDFLAKPFVKWAGGKAQLLGEFRKIYPSGLGTTYRKYAEPFVGGGAVLFDILNEYALDEAYISDTNKELISAYATIKDSVDELIASLRQMQAKYLSLSQEFRKIYYYKIRERFNYLITTNIEGDPVEIASLFIFLNKTCFNGLYRVNQKGSFNVPIGSYKAPTICDDVNLRNISMKLKNVNIVCADYREALSFIDNKTFVYFDPPYRPLTETANFTAYTDNLFDDRSQRELAEFVNLVNEREAKIVVSNSDPKNSKPDDNFFEHLYSGYRINRVKATRMINCNGEARGKVNELVITNF